MTIKDVPLDDISIEGGTQARAAINGAVVAEYAEAMLEGETLPPGVVFCDGATNHLADGFHRFHANRKIGAISMSCDVRTGTLQDARLFAYGANREHGLRRTNEDKRKAVQGMLADFAEWSDRAIAKHVGVAHTMVSSIRSPAVAAQRDENRAASAAKQAAKVEPGSTQQAGEGGETEASGVEPGSSSTETSAKAPTVEPGSTTPQADAAAERVAELEQMANELLADNNAMSAVFEADDKLAAAVAEGKKLRYEINGLRERVNGLMAEKNEAIRLMKSWRKRAEKAEKALATAGVE
ncbi:MAG TPA: hypothetical protein VGE36_13605 [Roseateles sp.]